MSPEKRTPPPLAADLMAAAPPIPPARHISAEEGAELIRRLNAPGGHDVALDVDQRTYLHTQPPLRDLAAVERVRAALADVESDEVGQAVMETLEWAAGRQERGPLSGAQAEHMPPRCSDLYHEEAVASRYIYGQSLHTESPLPRSREWAVAVEHTCMWLQCRTDDPPIGSETSINELTEPGERS